MASGQVCDPGVKPEIYVWDVKTRKVLNKFNDILLMGIDIVSFSPSGKRLIGIDNTVDHNLVIYDLTDKYSEGGCKMVEDKAGREPTVELRWVNED